MNLSRQALLISILAAFAFACNDGGTAAGPLEASLGGQLPEGDGDIFRNPPSVGSSSNNASDLSSRGADIGEGEDGSGSEEANGGNSSSAPGPVPEPGTLLIVGSGLAILGTTRRRRRRRLHNPESTA